MYLGAEGWQSVSLVACFHRLFILYFCCVGMPGGSLGGSYTSLEHVYRGTTLPHPKMGGGGVLDSIKRAFSNSGLYPNGGGSDPLIEPSDSALVDSAVIVQRYAHHGHQLPATGNRPPATSWPNRHTGTQQPPSTAYLIHYRYNLLRNNAIVRFCC